MVLGPVLCQINNLLLNLPITVDKIFRRVATEVDIRCESQGWGGGCAAEMGCEGGEGTWGGRLGEEGAGNRVALAEETEGGSVAGGEDDEVCLEEGGGEAGGLCGEVGETGGEAGRQAGDEGGRGGHFEAFTCVRDCELC